VANKIFALLSEELDPMRINLKCDPEDGQALRAQYPAIIPGYHMNKKHWNTVILDGSLSEELLQELIDQSNYLIVSSLSKSKRAEFNLSLSI
jgi:predicted DNA-binding protein (MmcQ/YjbR family)